MKLLGIVFLAVLASADENENWDKIRVKFTMSTTTDGINGFWKIGTTLSEAQAANWTIVTNPTDFGLKTVCASKTDLGVCALYDGRGFIAGLQYAIPTSAVEGQGIPYDFANFPAFANKTINGTDYWTSTFLIVSPLTLMFGGRRKADKLGDGLWIKQNANYIQIETLEKNLVNKTLYKKQNCLPGMGTQYFYNISKTTSCSDLEPFFLLVAKEQVVGIGWEFFGKVTPSGRNWYDEVDRQMIEMAVPLAPKCLSDLAGQYGLTSIRTYFGKEPWKIQCDQKKDSVVPITGLPKIFLEMKYKKSEKEAENKAKKEKSKSEDNII